MGGCSHQGQGSACGLLSSTIQCWSFPTVQNDLFKTTGDEWVLLNLNVTGYYLVNYDQNNWKKIHTQLQTDLSVGVCPPSAPAQLSSYQARAKDGAPDSRACPHHQPEVTSSVAPSRSSLSSTGLRSSMTPSTWPGEYPFPLRHSPTQVW